jgi:hypothetical protein
MIYLKNRGTICDTFAKPRYHLCHFYVLFQNATLLHNMLQNIHTKYKQIILCKNVPFIVNVPKLRYHLW